MRSSYVLVAARCIFGLFYAANGFAITAYLILDFGIPLKHPKPAVNAFAAALIQSGFVGPLLAMTYIFGGFALLRDRTAPLGIVLLAPAISVIFCFHIFLSGSWVWGTSNLLWLSALAYVYRESFTPLWNGAAAKLPRPSAGA